MTLKLRIRVEYKNHHFIGVEVLKLIQPQSIQATDEEIQENNIDQYQICNFVSLDAWMVTLCDDKKRTEFRTFMITFIIKLFSFCLKVYNKSKNASKIKF